MKLSFSSDGRGRPRQTRRVPRWPLAFAGYPAVSPQVPIGIQGNGYASDEAQDFRYLAAVRIQGRPAVEE